MTIAHESTKKRSFPAALSKLQKGLNRFLYTDAYMLLVMAIAFAAWMVESALMGFICMGVLAVIALLVADDLLPVLANLLGCILMLYTGDVDMLLTYWPVVVPIALAFVIFLVRCTYRKVKQIGNHKPFTLGRFFFPYLGVTVALFLGGVGTISTEAYVSSLTSIALLGPGMLLGYWLLANFIKRDSGHNIGRTIAKLLAYFGLFVALEMIVRIVQADLPLAMWEKGRWSLGWAGNRNVIAYMFHFTAPMCLYLFTCYRKTGWAYLLLGVLQYACLFLTYSRGGILAGFAGLLVGVIFMIIKAPDKRVALVSLIAILTAFTVVGMCFLDEFSTVFINLLDRGFDSSGRFDLYREAWAVFKDNLIVGAGMGYQGKVISLNPILSSYWFHSTVFQVLACMGIVGIVMYLFYYVTRIGFVFKHFRSGYAMFVLVAWIGFEGYSLIDPGTMIPFPQQFFSMLVLLGLDLMIPPKTKAPKAIPAEVA